MKGHFFSDVPLIRAGAVVDGLAAPDTFAVCLVVQSDQYANFVERIGGDTDFATADYAVPPI